MLKISNKTSVKLSAAVSVLFFAVIAAGAVVMPYLIDRFIDIKYAANGEVLSTDAVPAMYIVSFVCAYLILALMATADILLLKLVLRVGNRLVFTAESISLIRGVSWCACFIGAVFFVLGSVFMLAFVAGFCCIFLGICLRVVKNVIEEAMEIKAENDFTV